MAVEIRTVAEEEVPAYFRTISAGFGSPGSPDEDFAEWQTVAEYDQCFGALDGDRFVGGASAYSLEMTLPGVGWPPSAASATWPCCPPIAARAS